MIWLSDNKYNINWINLHSLSTNLFKIDNSKFRNLQNKENINYAKNNNDTGLKKNNYNTLQEKKYKFFNKKIKNYECLYLPNLIVSYYCINNETHELDEPISCYKYKNNFLHILTSESQNIVYEFDLIQNIFTHNYTINTHYDILIFYVTNDKSKILAHCLDNTIQIFSINDDKNVENINSIEIPGWVYYFSPIAFFNDTKLALYCGSLCIYDLHNNKWIKKEEIDIASKKEYHIKKISISKDERYIFLIYFNKYVEQYETNTFQLVGKYYIDKFKYEAISLLNTSNFKYKIEDELLFSIYSDFKYYNLEKYCYYPEIFKKLNNIAKHFVIVKSKTKIFIIGHDFNILSTNSNVDINHQDCIELFDSNRMIKFINFNTSLKLSNYMFFPKKISILYKYFLLNHFNNYTSIDNKLKLNDINKKRINNKNDTDKFLLNINDVNNEIVDNKLKKNINTNFKELVENLNMYLLENIFQKIKIKDFL